jgi:sugar phosphate isomerase/epimerase
MTRLVVHMAGREVELNKNTMSIGTTFDYDMPLKEQLPIIERVGFSHISVGARLEHSGYLKMSGRHNVKKMVANHGIAVCSIHTPFGENIDISSPNSVIASKTKDCYKRCIDAARYLGARVVIFHPTAYRQFDQLDRRKKTIVENVNGLLDYAGNRGVRLAVENEYFSPANDIMGFSLDMIADARYGICYDTSHDNLVPSRLSIFKKYGHRLLTTHLSDNRGTNDDHVLPEEGSFPWHKFCLVFSKIRFTGIPLLEVEMRESAFKSPGEFLQEAFTRGQRLLSACNRI